MNEWAYKTTETWQAELQGYIDRNKLHECSERESKIMSKIRDTIEHIKSHEDTIASRHKYELNGELHCLFYELHSMEKTDGVNNSVPGGQEN